MLGLVIFSLPMDTEGAAFFIVRPGAAFEFSSFRIFTLKPLCYAWNLRLRELNSSLLPGKTMKGKWGLQDLSLCVSLCTCGGQRQPWVLVLTFYHVWIRVSELPGGILLSLLPILPKRLVCFQLLYRFWRMNSGPYVGSSSTLPAPSASPQLLKLLEPCSFRLGVEACTFKLSNWRGREISEFKASLIYLLNFL